MEPTHDTTHDDDLAEHYSQETWDARYSESDRLWSGNPNPRLVEHVADVSPGTALDIGAGEGADAVWLAARGWTVTALDVSGVALERAAGHATDAGVADRLTTLRFDLMGDEPLPGGFDLVSAQFMHPPTERFAEIFTRIGDAVRAGGLLLVVGHHPDDLTTGLRSGHGHPELLFRPDQVAAVLDPSAWELLVEAAPTRPVDADHGHGHTEVTDSVVLARRR